MKTKRATTQSADTGSTTSAYDERWDGGEPGPDVGNHLDHRSPDAEEERIALGAGHEPGRTEKPHADSGAEADHRGEDQLPADVAGQRLLDPQRQGQAVPGRKTPVDRSFEPFHVEQHVDRDHDDEHEVEERHDDRECSALRERDGVLRVLGDLTCPEVVDPVGRLLLDLDPLEPVAVEPGLEAIDVLLGSGVPRGVRDRHVVVDPLGRRARLVDDDTAERQHDERDRRRKQQEDQRDREATG